MAKGVSFPSRYKSRDMKPQSMLIVIVEGFNKNKGWRDDTVANT